MTKMAVNPFPCGYELDLDLSQELDPVISSYNQSQIVILRWVVELGRIDINTEVSMLAFYLDLTRELILWIDVKSFLLPTGKILTIGWSCIRPTLILILPVLRSINGLTSMVTLRNKFLLTCHSQGVRMLVLECIWIETMLDISQCADQVQQLLSTWIWLWSSGYPRNNQQFKCQFFVRSLCQWSTEWKYSKACGTSWEWREFQLPVLQTYMWRIFQSYKILSVWSLLWKKRITRFFIIQWGRVLQRRSCWWLTFRKMIILWFRLRTA